ncbi:uncharacterized protein CC84DRAFT_1230805, partial [Paraphaeosphaeria sporulosa]
AFFSSTLPHQQTYPGSLRDRRTQKLFVRRLRIQVPRIAPLVSNSRYFQPIYNPSTCSLTLYTRCLPTTTSPVATLPLLARTPSPRGHPAMTASRMSRLKTLALPPKTRSLTRRPPRMALVLAPSSSNPTSTTRPAQQRSRPCCGPSSTTPTSRWARRNPTDLCASLATGPSRCSAPTSSTARTMASWS